MNDILIDETKTLYEITENYPETIPVFISNGFSQMADKEKRAAIGKNVTLKNALTLKQIDSDIFIRLLIQTINNLNSEKPKLSNKDKITVTGLLPCPVRIPLLEAFSAFSDDYKIKTGLNIEHELQSASMGIDWVEDRVRKTKNANELPDVFLSAGFNLFFDKELIGKFKDIGTFKDFSSFSSINKSFDGIELRDPKHHYSVIAVVSAVFLVNQDQLNGREIPRSWEDVLKPEFTSSISLPVGDFDLFNGILLNIYKKFGDKGIKALRKNLLRSMHPSQMIKVSKQKIVEGQTSNGDRHPEQKQTSPGDRPPSPPSRTDLQRSEKPAVTIIPYFFTKMVNTSTSMKIVWPEDGSIICPIFLLTKAEKEKELKPIVDFFSSKATGEILANKGLFPSLNPDVINPIQEGNKFMWLGWDFIYNNDIAGLINHCNKIFSSIEAE